MYKDTTFSVSKTTSEKMDSALKSFLCSAIGCNIDRTTCSQYLFNFCLVTEGIYHLNPFSTDVPRLYPLKTSESYPFTLFFIESNRKFYFWIQNYTSLNDKVLPCASDTNYRNWLKEQGKYKLATPQQDITSFLDNVGKYIVKIIGLNPFRITQKI